MIVLEELAIRAGDFHAEGLSMALEPGTYAVLMGRTGCGKTTLLETICGLKRPAAGRILLDDRDVTDLRPAARGIGYVPQDGALFPTMSVRQHLVFPLKIRRVSRRERSRRVAELAALLRIEPLLERRPPGLSGGERQRVALGRALAFRPAMLCLDEPLSALDEGTREEMEEALEELHQGHSVTTLHVTHSRAEARRLGGRIFALDEGGLHALELNA